MTADDGLALSCGSPSINTGTNTGITYTDILGNLRPQFLKADMGAYESPFDGAPIILPITQTRIYVKKGITTGLQDGSSWANAMPEAAIALRTAHANVSVTEIWVSAGTYLPMYDAGLSSCPADNRAKTFLLKNGVAMYGGFDGTETLVTARNWTLNPTILSGDLDNNDNPANFSNHTNNAYHVVLSYNSSSATRLDGFTVKGGNANNTAPVDFGFGSGAWNQNGAGVFSRGGSNNLTIANIFISRNIAVNGGGISFTTSSNPNLTNVTIANNTAGRGGGIYNVFSSPILTNVTIANNAVTSGGGIYNENSNPNLTNVTITNNTASSVGGGIFNDNNSAGTIKNSILYNNTTASTFYLGREEIYSLNTSGTKLSISFSCVRDPFPMTNVTNGGNNINTNPLFINSADPDGADNIFMTADDGLALQCTSPCINTGTNTGAPALDILGNARAGANKDMGAYEVQNGGTFPSSILLATSAESNLILVKQCENGSWTYYAPASNSTKWLIGINWAVDGTLSALNAAAKNAAQVKIILDAAPTSATNTPLKQGIWTTSRYWDVNIGVNTLDEPVAVRYYFDIAEITAINAAANTFAITNGGVYIPAKFFKTVGSAFNPATQVTYNNINSGNVITLTPNTTPTNTHNGVSYIEFTAISSFSGGGAFAQVGVTPLPVELLSFSGKNNQNTNLLTWATTNEVNNAYFEIERSTNAIDFVKIGVVEVNTSNESIKNYNFNDVNFSETTNYYRLKQVDNNEKIDYSRIISIKSSENSIFSVNISPNPSKDSFVIDINSNVSDEYSIVVYNMQGVSVVNTDVSGNKAIVSLDNCAVGVYFVKVSNEKGIITKKIIKE